MDSFLAERSTLRHGVIEYQVFITHHLAYLGSSLADALDVQGFALNLAQLDTEAAQFHLGVNTSHILYLALLIPPTEVASMVHADRTAPTVFLHKWTIDKGLSRAFGQSPITATNLHTSKAQLTSHPLRQEVASSIDDEVPVVSHTLADGDILDTLTWLDSIIGRIVSTLRRSIDIDNLNVVAEHTVHLLTTSRCKANGQVVEGIEQQTGHRCRIAATRTLMIYQELADSREILANLRRHDVERTTQRQDGIHILNMRIERERTMSADAVVGCQFLHVDDHSDEVAQTCLMEHRTLRLACRATGIDHVSKAIGTG